MNYDLLYTMLNTESVSGGGNTAAKKGCGVYARSRL